MTDREACADKVLAALACRAHGDEVHLCWKSS